MQELIVGLIVFIAAVVVARRYGPKKLQHAIVRAQAFCLRSIGLHKQAARLYQAGCGCHDGAVTLEALKRTMPKKK